MLFPDLLACIEDALADFLSCPLHGVTKFAFSAELGAIAARNMSTLQKPFALRFFFLQNAHSP
jgi:hypothetical protein